MLRWPQNSAKINTYLRSKAKSVQGVSSQEGGLPTLLTAKKILDFQPLSRHIFIRSVWHPCRQIWKANVLGLGGSKNWIWCVDRISILSGSRSHGIKFDSIRFFPERRSVLTVSRHTISRNLASGSANISRISFALPRRGKKNIYKKADVWGLSLGHPLSLFIVIV